MAKSKKVETYDAPPETLTDHPFYGLKLDKDQTVFRDAIWNPEIKIVFVDAKAGSGKAQPVDTIIPTPDGEKRLGDLVAGDYVFDRLGNPTKVLGVFNQGIQRAYKVVLSDGRSTLCCSEHLWTYRRNNDGLFITETLSSMLQRSILSGKDSSSARYNIPTNGAVKYTTKELPVDPYILGLAIGDGCLTGRRFEYSTNDTELPEKIADEFNCVAVKNSGVNYTYHFKHTDGHVLTVVEAFSNTPEICTYSYNKKIPNCYLYGDIDQRFALLQGLLDTDGSICENHGRYTVRFSTTSEHLCNDFVKLCRSLGIKTSVHVDKRDTYKNSNGKAYSILLLCENEIKPKLFRLKRRLTVAENASKIHKVRKYEQIAIRDVIDTGVDCEMVCIYVDNPEHLYLTNDFIVTHNTTISFATANLLYEYGLYDGIIYIVSPYGESKQGFLPGSITEKSEVYFEPLYQAIVKCNLFPMKVICDESMMSEDKGNGYVKCLTHTYLRGTNFENKVIILDETQNYNFADLKKTLTRINDNCKVIVIGHTMQKDTYDTTDAFQRYIRYYESMHSEKVAICKLTKNYRGWISETADALEFQ